MAINPQSETHIIEQTRLSADGGEKTFEEVEKGSFRCSRCHQVLYSVEDKFSSNYKFPSFRRAATGKCVVFEEDFTFGLHRTAAFCSGCHLHLGYVYEDGVDAGDKHPKAKIRHCILTTALEHNEAPFVRPTQGPQKKRDKSNLVMIGALLVGLPVAYIFGKKLAEAQRDL